MPRAGPTTTAATAPAHPLAGANDHFINAMASAALHSTGILGGASGGAAAAGGGGAQVQ